MYHLNFKQPFKWKNTKLCLLIIAKVLLATLFIVWLWLVFVGVPDTIVSKFKLAAEDKFKTKIEVGGLKLHYHLGGWHADDVHVLFPLPNTDDFNLDIIIDKISWKGRWLSRKDFNQSAHLHLKNTTIKLSQNDSDSKDWQLAENLNLNLVWNTGKDKFDLELQSGKVLNIHSRYIAIKGKITQLFKKELENATSAASSLGSVSSIAVQSKKTQKEQINKFLNTYESYLETWQLAQKDISLQAQIELVSFKDALFKAQGTLVAEDWMFHDESLFNKGYCQFSWDGNILDIKEVKLSRPTKELVAKAQFDLVNKSLAVNVQSNLGMLAYVDDFLVDKSPWKISQLENEAVILDATAKWNDFDQLIPGTYTAKGSVELNKGYIDHLYFDSLKGQFHFQDNQGILQDLTLVSQREKVVINYLKSEDKAQYKIDSTLDFTWSKLLLKPFSFKKYIADFSDQEASKVTLKLEGFSYLNKRVWESKLNLKAEKVNYLDLNLSELKSTIELSQDKALYTDVLLAVSPSDKQASQEYAEKTWHQFCNIEQVIFDRRTNIYQINGLEGQIFPHLLVSTLTKSPASYLSDYQFNKPPYVVFSGSVGTDEDTNWTAFIKHDQAAKVRLGSFSLPLDQINVKIKRNQQELDVSDIQAKIWGGNMTGKAKVQLPNPVNKSQDVAWLTNIKVENIQAASLSTHLKADSIASVAEGVINGRLQLYNTSEKMQTLQGNSYIEYKEGSLFAVPIFGPISTILSKMTGSKNMGYQQSTRSNAQLSILNNNIYIQRLDLRTNSFKFEGEGVIALETPNQAEIVISTETRGLLNILKYPLAPLTKFLTFKGEGALKEIEWGISPLSSKGYAVTPPVLPTMQEFSLNSQPVPAPTPNTITPTPNENSPSTN